MKEKYIVEQVKNGKTYLTVKFTYKTGETTKQYSKTFNVAEYGSKNKAMKEACRHRDIKRAELLTVGLPDQTVMHPRELLELAIKKEHLSAGTKWVLLSTFDAYIDNTMAIQNITAIDIEESMAKIRYEKSQEVINKLATCWRKITKTARRLRLITSDPMDEVVVPKSKYVPDERTVKTVSDEAVNAMIDALAHPALKTEETMFNNSMIIGLILVLRYTGVRPAEAEALRREDIDFENSLIRIRSMYGTNEKGTAIVGTKTKLSTRTVPMTISCAMALRSVMQMSENEFIFTSYRGKIFTSNIVDSKLRRVALAKGIEPFSLYTLRHQFSSDLITGGVDPRTVMELMGHSSTSMTVGTYARSNIEKKREALVEIGRSLSENTEKIQKRLS